MRPLPLAALLLFASPWARAQSRFGAVEAAVENSGPQAGSLSSSLTGIGAPQLVTLNLAAPYAAAALAQSPALAALPVSFISPAPQAEIKAAPAPLAGARAILGGAPADLEKSSVSELIDFTKRLFGESSRDGYKSADYYRPGAPLLFGSEAVFRYRSAGEVKSYLVAGDSWPLIPGGHWEAINLPHAILVVPVLDGPPAPKRDLFSRLFKDEPETSAAKAARRHADALRPHASARATAASLRSRGSGRRRTSGCLHRASCRAPS